MNGNKAVLCSLLLISILVATLTAACAPEATTSTQEKTLKLGCIMPFSGPAAQYGQRGRYVADVYVDLVNEDGGVKIGNDVYKVALNWGDDQFAPAPAAAAAKKLIYDDGVMLPIPRRSSLSP